MRAFSDNIIVEPIKGKISEKIYLPPSVEAKLTRLKKGIVVSAGCGTDDMTMPVGPGNTVVYGKNSPISIEVNGRKLEVIKLHHLICAK